MNKLIKQIYSTGYVEDTKGNKYKLDASSINYETGSMLYEFIRAFKPEKTLEIGMAYSLSTLFICQAHRYNSTICHTAIDPFEEKAFNSIGLLNIERANLKRDVVFTCYYLSQQGLCSIPRLAAKV